MRYLLLVLLLAAPVFAGQEPCADCPDPSRPWMRCNPPGCPEISCASSHAIERFQRENPGKRIERCACQHMCDPADPNAEVTGDRHWDPRCSARCNPSNCQCDHPCES